MDANAAESGRAEAPSQFLGRETECRWTASENQRAGGEPSSKSWTTNRPPGLSVRRARGEQPVAREQVQRAPRGRQVPQVLHPTGQFEELTDSRHPYGDVLLSPAIAISTAVPPIVGLELVEDLGACLQRLRGAVPAEVEFRVQLWVLLADHVKTDAHADSIQVCAVT